MPTWTKDQKLEYLLRLPWTIIPDSTPEGDHLLRVVELPAAVGCGDDEESLVADFWESFRSTIEAYLEMGGNPPLPASVKGLPWMKGQQRAPAIAHGVLREEKGHVRIVKLQAVTAGQRPTPVVNTRTLETAVA
jgi:hypothetical protein